MTPQAVYRGQVESIFSGLMEETVWEVSVLELKRARNFHRFSAEQEICTAEKKNAADKDPTDPVHDCPVCGREVAAARFAPHLSKCLGMGGRGPAAKRSDYSESESVAKGSSHTPLDLAAASRNKAGGNAKRRGRPPKKLAAVSLSPAEHDALLSNAINNATQRLHLQGIMSTTPSLKPAPPTTHPLSQSHVATPPAAKPKRKKKKDNPMRNRSRNSSQASSSSDSDEQEGGEGEEEGEEEEGEVVEDGHQTFAPAGQLDGENEGGQQRGISENPSISPASVAPTATATVLPRPVLKRRSSSQADSTDGSDSD